MDKQDKAELIEAFDNLGISYQSYSGRGMYGKQCLGITPSDGESVANTMLRIAIELIACGDASSQPANILEALLDPSEDSLGRGSIIYWPNISWDDFTEEESEDEG